MDRADDVGAFSRVVGGISAPDNAELFLPFADTASADKSRARDEMEIL